MGSITHESGCQPAFDELPLQPKGPRGNAWGLFGKNDELGRLNLLTPTTVRAASSEIKEGLRVSLDWSLTFPSNTSFDRQPMTRQVRNKVHRSINDETLTFDTQGSTQWDGLKHFGYIDEEVFYNGHVQEEFDESDVLGTQVIAKNGGIVGRGVLLDWAGWADRRGYKVDGMSQYGIPATELIAVAEECNIEFRRGDILFVRTGFTRDYEKLSSAEELDIALRPEPQFIGVEDSIDMLRFIWENQFAAVAGDAPAFEQCPLGFNSDGKYMLHQWCIGGWGMPLGEYFYLEELSETCNKLNRYTFFLSSMPLKVPGGVASPQLQ